MENGLLTSPVTSPHASEPKALVLRLTLLAPDIAILRGPQQKRASLTFKVRRREFVTVLDLAGWHPFEATKSLLLLGSIDRLIRTSMARNAKQINAPVGAEVFSLTQQQFEKYGLRASSKPCDFNHIKNPYQMP